MIPFLLGKIIGEAVMNSLDSLSKRARRALTSLDCRALEDAAKLAERDLLRCADVGPKTLYEIKDRLKRIGLGLKPNARREELSQNRDASNGDLVSRW